MLATLYILSTFVPLILHDDGQNRESAIYQGNKHIKNNKIDKTADENDRSSIYSNIVKQKSSLNQKHKSMNK